MPGSETLVLDASVGVKVILPEEGSGIAETLLDRGAERPGVRLVVPDLFFPECANAVRKGIERHRLPAGRVEEGLREICESVLESVPSRDLVSDAFVLARSEGLSVYDAVYVALSDRTNAPLLTADRKLHERLRRTGHRVRGLWEFGG